MKTSILFTLTIILTAFMIRIDFLTEQKKYERVRTAFSEKGRLINEKLKENNINIDELNILMIVFKAEQQLDMYAKRKSENSYKKISTYEICASSGQLGPKRRQGDNQVPEGFYHIDRFNPVSNFYLSLSVSYPNQSDRKKSSAANLGGDIFIHGSCVTIGCMPMTDDKIKEIYLYAIHARQNGQLKIPVYIFPFKMTDHNVSAYKDKYKSNAELLNFWANLKTGFDKFEMEKKEIKVSVDKEGNYTY